MGLQLKTRNKENISFWNDREKNRQYGERELGHKEAMGFFSRTRRERIANRNLR